MCRVCAWKTLHGCRPGGVAGSSGGGPGGGRAGEGTAGPQSVLCSSSLPPELEPMDWRQLRSSPRQSRGSGSGWGPKGKSLLGPPCRAEPAGAPRQVAACFGTHFPICATRKIMSVLPTSRAACRAGNFGCILYRRANLETGVVAIPTTKFGGLPGPFQVRAVIASPSSPLTQTRTQSKPGALGSRAVVQGPPREAILTAGWPGLSILT